jgi:hypothetical protein
MGTSKLLLSSTYGKTAPTVIEMASFAHTVVVFLEDFRDGRLTADEVCDTLLAAAIARNFVKPAGKLTNAAEVRAVVDALKDQP